MDGLTVVVEMLEALETLTHAGRRHMMDKVLGVLGSKVEERWQPEIEPLMEQLGREARRPVPGTEAFRRSAELVLGALAADVERRQLRLLAAS